MTERAGTIAEMSCASRFRTNDTVLLGHGSGGTLSADLIRDVFLPALGNPILSRLDDQAIVTVNGQRLAFTTDTFVVKPLFFPGGDIGSLAVHGTINDLAMGGATPLFLSAAFIIEEGFSIKQLERIVESMQIAAKAAGVQIVAGDTKVVEKGKGDGLFINTTGVGSVADDVTLSADSARPGDQVLLSGPIGDHGIAILAQREGIQFETTIESDSAPLHNLVGAMLHAAQGIRCMRDPTRGGLSSALNEIAAQSKVAIELEERAIPIREEVASACELLGLDPMYVANEGKLIAIVAAADADAVLQAMRSHPLGRRSQIIGTVKAATHPLVTMRTTLGTTRIVDMLSGDQLPRIC